MPDQRRQPTPPPGNEPTTAIPTQRPRPQDAEAATEKLNTRDEDEPKRRGGVSGLSAQDLLRREGRI
jgi:RND superfamily putative drug exporter